MKPKADDRRPAGQEGVALVYVLLVVLVVSAAIAVTFVSALSEQRLASAELQFEDTVHVAEAGAEQLLEEVTTNSDFSNADAPACSSAPGGCTEEQLRDWAVTEASNESKYTTFALSEGESVGLRPESSNAVYGVGFVPSRAAVLADSPRSYVRVIRMQLASDDSFATGDYTFLANTKLHINGGGTSRLIGGAKSNIDVTPGGDQWNNTGVDRLELVGDCDPGPCPDTYTNVSNKTPVPFGTDRQLYDSKTAIGLVTEGTTPWYDYCSGTWRERENAYADPCSGPEVTGNIGFSGTSLGGSGSTDGVYYFAGGESVDLSSGSGGTYEMTVITTGTVELPGGPPFTMNWTPSYPGLLAYTGEITGFAGTPKIQAGEPGIIYAVNDITVSGTGSATDVSWIAGGTLTLNGGGNGTYELLGTPEDVDTGAPATSAVVSWDEL